METFDYIVVGAGTAGCLLANRLSADPANSVLLIESGGPDDYRWIHIPVGYLYCIGNPRTDWLYDTVAEPGLAGRSIKYPRGRVWGGCSSINGMIYMRGQAADYDHWAERAPGWEWSSVLPYFKRHEDYHRLDGGGTDPAHGHGGEWRVEGMRLRWAILDAFQEAAAQAGIPKTEDFNRGDNFGCGYFEVNQRRGVRWNAASAFLRPVLARSNLKVQSRANVSRLVFDDASPGRVVGVEFQACEPNKALSPSRLGPATQVRARREVVLSSGSIGSVQILERSGIGAAERLRDLGIEVRLDKPGVGENLQDHLQLRTIYKIRGVRTLNQAAGSLWGKAWMGLQYFGAKRGPMTMSPSQLGAFAYSSDEVDTPDLEYHVQPLSLDKFGDPLHRFAAFTASVCHIRPQSRGSVHINSADVCDAPRIAPNYLSTESDRLVAARAIRLTRRIVGSAALGKYGPDEYLPGPAFQTDDQLAEAAAQIGTTIFHPVGTCRMGARSDPESVVDNRLRVIGMDGLRIADASVMPTITSGNTNSPTLMIAERAAEWILAGE